MSQAYFNEKAGKWDQFAAEKDPAKLEQMVARLNLKPDSIILDVGTGTGIMLPFLVRAVGQSGQVIGLDYADLMLRQAAKKQHSGNITFLLADINYIPVKDGIFEAVVCYSSFPHFNKKPHVLAEIFRVLKSPGRVFICHTSGREIINRIHREIPLFMHDLLPEKPEIDRLLVSAGFQNIRIEDEADSYMAAAEKLEL